MFGRSVVEPGSSHLRARAWPLGIAVAALLSGSFAPAQSSAQLPGRVLDTPHFLVRIEVRCAEGEVTCDDVVYAGRNKRTGASVTIVGRTSHTLCADGVTPCRFLGYAFETGGFRYFVGEDGQLLVRKGAKVLVQEFGSWQ
jgi:hypothetical protein